jgi:hypothetical protein
MIAAKSLQALGVEVAKSTGVEEFAQLAAVQ